MDYYLIDAGEFSSGISDLEEYGAPISVQQALMRHADIGTTMNVYGDSVAESQRKANSKVVSLLLSKKTV
jgi:integrase